MKFVAVLTIFPVMALGATIGPLSQSEFFDTEVATNIPFQVDFGTMSRIEFTLSLSGSPTNNVEVWIGTDSNVDGELSLGESDQVVGYDCGKWFCRDSLKDNVVQVSQPLQGTDARLQRTFVFKRRQLQSAWNRIKIVRRGVAEIGEIVVVEGKKPGVALIMR